MQTGVHGHHEAASMKRDGALKADETENKRCFQKSLSTSRDSNVVTPLAPEEDTNFIQHHRVVPV